MLDNRTLGNYGYMAETVVQAMIKWRILWEYKNISINIFCFGCVQYKY